MHSMKILIYGINFSPELTGIGKFTGEMAEWFAKNQNNVKVVTAVPYYPQWKIHENYKNFYKKEKAENIEIIRCPLYVPSKPNTFRRLLHLLSFSLSSFFPMLRLFFWKPDLIIQVSPTLFCSLQTIILAKICRAKSILHIQDFEVDAMFNISLSGRKRLKDFAFWIEKIILKNFDFVSTISDAMIKRLKVKGIPDEAIVSLPNWANIDDFKDAQRDESLLDELKIDKNKRIVLYSGNMGEKQGLEIIIHAAKDMESYEDIQFLMIGDGSSKERLKKLSASIDAKNIKFLPLQPYEDLPKILASASCHLIVQKPEAADIVFPSKLVNILAVGGNSVATASKDSSLGRVYIENEGIGVLLETQSICDLRNSILKAIQMKSPNQVAIDYAKKNLGKEEILTRFMMEII